jgi:hypothetical protein
LIDDPSHFSEIEGRNESVVSKVTGPA